MENKIEKLEQASQLLGQEQPDEIDKKIDQINEIKEKQTKLDDKTKEELEKEKRELIEQIKELEEDYYHPKDKMPDEEIDKITQDLLNHPLFWKEIPKNFEENDHFKALQQIVYDDEPENIAKHSLQKGNEHFKKGQDKTYFMKLALEQYTEGIEANGRDKQVNAKLYNNRALIQIKRKNYGKAIQDCKDAIMNDNNFVKAYYRCAQALVYLFKYKEAIVILEKAEKLDPQNKDIKKLIKESQTKYNNDLLKTQQKKDQKVQEQSTLFNALKIRNIYLGKAIMDFPDSCNKSCWLEDDGSLHFPAFIQYPEFQQMDYIQDIHESHKLQENIKALFDENGHLVYDLNKVYNPNNVELYLELNQVEPYYQIKNISDWPKQRGLIKIDSRKKMATLMATKGFVLPKVAEFYMVCPDSKDFYEHFKRNFEIIKR
ncbi:hypothetical protein PPERSA_09041 [Pseudocohnilembus persalinus]|uniref:Cns1/TTC4 wheel domain-containing protein n=1 Tax=Pseudocohnilembus persalinus TaxID=266149 RepID=A0A0V0R361_PSEPJ|nr:hypothetical protein PPERSA_09041 [Pseudocohnilembus persalinus]|eukprot:KRX08937.1 hypothetical protein PPERSA_09041 [Pseudocohnilembus persalinus]